MFFLNHLFKHWFAYTVIVFFIYITAFSYIRFFVTHNYQISFEGECDPIAHSCFIGCKDDACENEYYYKTVERPANEVLALCGPDITDCAKASFCESDQPQCVITYCDTSITGENCEEVNTERESEGTPQ
jgi:hypothetical protein